MENVVLNLKNLNEFNKDNILIICINYNTEEFNRIKKENYINIKNNIYHKVKESQNILLNIKFKNENVKSTIKIIKDMKKVFKICKNAKKTIGLKIDNQNIIANIDILSEKDNLYFSVESALLGLMINDKKERLTYIYEKACEYLDKEVVDKNVCGFIGDKCSVKRNTNCTMGCCHHYPHKRTGILRNEKLQLCEYQIDKKCTANCITCKLFMCDELIKKGYNYNVFNVPLINCFFNVIQKLVLSISFFTTENDILKTPIIFPK